MENQILLPTDQSAELKDFWNRNQRRNIMKKEAFVTKEQIEEIVKTYPTPFHIYDEKGLRKKLKDVKDAFSWNKGFKEYFAVKANPNPFLINIMKLQVHQNIMIIT